MFIETKQGFNADISVNKVNVVRKAVENGKNEEMRDK